MSFPFLSQPFIERIFRGERGLLIIALLLFGVNLVLPRDMWVQDEARYAEVLRQMVKDGHWLVPYLNGEPYAHKPPLYFWVVALAYFVFGNMELAFRLVSAASTLVAAFGVLQLGTALAGKDFGERAAWLFLSAFCTLIVAQIARMDMMLTAAVVYAWLQLLRFKEQGLPRNLFGFWALTLLCFAIKGPITFLFTLAPAFLWVALEKGWTGLKSLRPLLALVFLAVAVVAWVGVVWSQGHEEYLREIWQRQLLGRAVNSWSHKEPFYFYFMLLPLLLMPWLGLVIRGTRRLYRERPRLSKMLAVFTLVPLLGLSLLSGKLFIYVEPVIPAFALLGAYGLSGPAYSAATSRWLSLPPAIFVAALSGAALWLWLNYPALQGLVLAVAIAGLVVLLVLALLLALVSPSLQQWVAAWLLLSFPLSWLVFGLLPYQLNVLFSARPLGEFVAAIAAPSVPIGVVNTTPGILNNYADRNFTELSAAQAVSWFAAHPDGVLIVKTNDAKAVFGATGIPAACRVNRSFDIELKQYHVVAGC